jgi:hypothetical protein
MMASGFEGWLYGIGRIGWVIRVPLIGSAVGFLVPGAATDLIALAILIVAYIVGKLQQPRMAISR